MIYNIYLKYYQHRHYHNQLKNVKHINLIQSYYSFILSVEKSFTALPKHNGGTLFHNIF